MIKIINNKLRGIDNNIIHEDYNNFNNIGMNNNKIQSEPLTNEELREYFFNLKKNDDNSKEDEKMKNLNNLLNSRPDLLLNIFSLVSLIAEIALNKIIFFL